MRIHRISIEAFRGISQLSLDLDPLACTLLVGENGCGKSSILDSLALSLSPLIERIFRWDKTNSKQFSTYDIDVGQFECVLRTNISFENLNLEFNSTWRRKGPRSSEGTWGDAPVRRMTERLNGNFSKNVNSSFPVVVYYPVDRYVVDPSGVDGSEWAQFDQTDAYHGALNGSRMDFQGFFKWFRFREDIENEYRIEDESYRDKQIDAVRTSIAQMFTGFLSPRIRRDPPRMVLKKKDDMIGKENELRIEQLSGGQRCLITMVADIARRLAVANPGLPKPLEGSGVILIDEIELHLHPKWQRMIIPALIRIFPHCQFIVTTHSPQVMSEVETRSIYLLSQTPDGIKAEGPLRFYGRDSNRILEELGTEERPREVQELLRDYFRKIDEKKYEEALEVRNRLEEKMGPDEPEFARADVLIRAREILDQ